MRLLTCLGLFALAPAVLAQGFYEVRLRAGQGALAAGRSQEAVEDLRIAAFGLLDRPAMLCEALDTLAVGRGKGQTAKRRWTRRSRAWSRSAEACLLAARRGWSRPCGRNSSLVRKKLSAPLADQVLAAPPSPTAVATIPPSPTVPPAPTQRPTGAPTVARSPVTPSITSAAVPTPTPSPGSAPLPSSSPAPAREEPPVGTPSNDLDRQPQLKVTTRPVYPASAPRVGGVVLLRVLVSEKGEPARVEVTRGVQPDLDQAAVAAVRQWLFEPGKKAGKAVAAWMTVAVPFDSPSR